MMDRLGSVAKNAGLVGVLTVLAGCGGGGGGSSNSGGGGGGKSFNEYFPDIDAAFREPYFQSETSNNSGLLLMESYRSGGIIIQSLIPLSTDTGVQERNIGYTDRTIILATDPKGNYLPLLGAVPIPNKSKNLYLRDKSTSRVHKNVIFNTMFNGVDMPHYTGEITDRTPNGLIYLGSHFLNGVKSSNINTHLGGRKDLALLFLDSGGGRKGVYSFSSSTGPAVDSVDIAVEGINSVLFGGINTQRPYDVYMLAPMDNSEVIFNDPLLIFSEGKRTGQNPLNILNLYPIDSRDPTKPLKSWTYTDGNSGYGKITIERNLKDVNGKKVIVASQSGGLEEYLGLKGDEMKHVGFRDPQGLEVYFDPPITIGSGNIGVGTTYYADSKIIVKGHPEISGSIQSTRKFISRGQILLPDKTPFGDVILQEEDTTSHLKNSNTGQEDLESGRVTRTFEVNVGPITIDNGTNKLYLTESSGFQSNINSMTSNRDESSISPMTVKIANSIKKVMEKK